MNPRMISASHDNWEKTRGRKLMLSLTIILNWSFQERDDQQVLGCDCPTVGLTGNRAFTPAAL